VRRFDAGARSMVRMKQQLCDERSFAEVVKKGVMNHDPNLPGGREGDGCNQ
jgi:hypothetical protein